MSIFYKTCERKIEEFDVGALHDLVIGSFNSKCYMNNHFRNKIKSIFLKRVSEFSLLQLINILGGYGKFRSIPNELFVAFQDEILLRRDMFEVCSSSYVHLLWALGRLNLLTSPLAFAAQNNFIRNLPLLILQTILTKTELKFTSERCVINI